LGRKAESAMAAECHALATSPMTDSRQDWFGRPE
jgi:hypothetical protein